MATPEAGQSRGGQRRGSVGRLNAYYTRFRWACAIQARYELQPAGFRVLCALCIFADKDAGTCYPTEETLAAEIGMSVSTVKRGLRELKAKSVVAAVGDARRNNQYALLLWSQHPHDIRSGPALSPTSSSDGSGPTESPAAGGSTSSTTLPPKGVMSTPTLPPKGVMSGPPTDPATPPGTHPSTSPGTSPGTQPTGEPLPAGEPGPPEGHGRPPKGQTPESMVGAEYSGPSIGKILSHMYPPEDSTGEEVWRYVQMLDRAGEGFARFLTAYAESDDPFFEPAYVGAGSQIGLSRRQMTRLAEYLGLEETQEFPEHMQDLVSDMQDLESGIWLRRVRRSDIS